MQALSISSVIQLRAALEHRASPAKARVLSAFFKTGPGQYAEGDQFLGVTVPDQRIIAGQCVSLPLKDIAALLKSPIHEERLTALLVLVGQFKQADDSGRGRIADFYLKNLKRVNNWDLVDATAHHILGAHVHQQNKGIDVLLRLTRSKNLWERRVAMVSTFYFIHQKSHKEALMVAEVLLKDKHDLMHKAVGWMLREVGKRASQEALEAFLRRHYKNIPRTALRYAIERFPPAKRRVYLNYGN